ncbi:MAG: 7-carboxy-7-deazaguanine synthase QueE [Desulfurobacteriaceae bacterium]
MRICEVFESIQGEGLTLGTPSFFIRTGRCSVGCLFCDTKYSWSSGRELRVDEIVGLVVSSGLPEVVITGGEPFEEEELPNLVELLTSLPSVRRVTVETCSYIFRELPKSKLHLVLSPKPPTMGVEFPLETLLKFLEFYKDVELKYTLYDERDLDLFEGFLFSNSNIIPQPIVLQPIHHPKEDYAETFKRVWNMVRRRERLLKSFEVRLIPQVHKLLGMK